MVFNEDFPCVRNLVLHEVREVLEQYESLKSTKLQPLT